MSVRWRETLLAPGQAVRDAPCLSMLLILLAAQPFIAFSSFGLGPHDSQRLSAMILLSTVALGACWNGKRPAPSFSNRTAVLALAGFFGCGFISSLYAFAPAIALHEWASFALILLLAAMVAQESAPQGVLERALPAAGLACAAYLFKSAATYLVAIVFGFEPLVTDLVFGFDNYRFFNHVQTVSLPLLVLLAMRGSAWRPFWLGVAGGWWALLFFSAGRGTMAALACSTLAALVLFHGAGRRWTAAMAKTALIGLALHLALFVLLPRLRFGAAAGLAGDLVGRTLESPLSAREILWEGALKMLSGNPWLGVGPAHFAHHGSYLGLNAHPHNWVLQIAAEWGIPALVCLVIVLAAGLARLFNAIRLVSPACEHEQMTGVAFFAVAISILADGLVSGLIVMPASQLWIALFIGLAWGWVLRANACSKVCAAHGAFPRRGWLRAGAAALAFALWFGVLPDAMRLQERQMEALQSNAYPNRMLYPRIWLAGYF